MNLNDTALGSVDRASLVFRLAKFLNVGPLADFPFVTHMTGIRAKQTFVDFSLSNIAKDVDIRDERDVEVHVASMRERTRRRTAKVHVASATGCV